MKFTVKRSEWLRGEADAYLLRAKDSKKCCLGFLALAKGFTNEEIYEKGQLEELSVDIPGYVKKCEYEYEESVYFDDTSITARAIEINDSTAISDEVREEQLKAIFAEAGDEIEFVD